MRQIFNRSRPASNNSVRETNTLHNEFVSSRTQVDVADRSSRRPVGSCRAGAGGNTDPLSTAPSARDVSSNFRVPEQQGGPRVPTRSTSVSAAFANMTTASAGRAAHLCDVTNPLAAAAASRSPVGLRAASRGKFILEKLITWVLNAPSGEENLREEVAVQIELAHRNKSEYLYLDDMQLTSLPRCMHELVSLKRLSVTHNKIGSIPDLPETLEDLYINHNPVCQANTIFVNNSVVLARFRKSSDYQINTADQTEAECGDTFPERLFNVYASRLDATPLMLELTNWVRPSPIEERSSRWLVAARIAKIYTSGLCDLDLNNLNLTSLPDCLHRLNSLKNLSIQLTKLEQLPVLPPGLEVLDMSGIKIHEIPQNFLPKGLVSLSASCCGLKRLPRLPVGLKELRVDHNKLNILPKLPKTLEKLCVVEAGLILMPELHQGIKEIAGDKNSQLIYCPKIPESLTKLLLGHIWDANVPANILSTRSSDDLSPNCVERFRQWQQEHPDKFEPDYATAFTKISTEMIPDLVAHGADVNCRNAEGKAAMELAICEFDSISERDYGRESTRYDSYERDCAVKTNLRVRALLDVGADIHLPDRDGNSLLHRQTMRGNVETVRLLLENGADVTARNFGTLPTIARYSTRQAEIENALVRQCWTWGGNDRATPLHLAVAFCNDPELVDLLCKHGALTETGDDNRSTPLHWAAACSSHSAIIDALIENGADVNAIDVYGATPLHYAVVRLTSPEVVHVLLNHGADPDIVLPNGGTLLQLARSRTDSLAEQVVDALRSRSQITSDDLDGAASVTTETAAEDPSLDRDFAFALQLQEQENAFDMGSLGEAATPLRARTSRGHSGVASTSVQSEPTPSGSQISAEQIARYLTIPLVQNAESWYEFAEHKTSAGRLRDWHAMRNENNADHFSEFLRRLSETSDYQSSRLRPAFTRRVLDLLDAVRVDAALRQSCFTLAEDLGNTCGDGVALTFNRMDAAKITLGAESGTYSTDDLIKMRTGMFRLNALEKIAIRKVASLGSADEVEVILGFQTMLAERLELPGVSASMLYSQYAQITEGDLNVAVEKIRSLENRNEYVEFLGSWGPWQQALKRNHPAVFVDLDTKVETEQEQIAIQPAFTTDHDYMQICDELKTMQTARHKFAVNNLTREFVLAYRQHHVCGV